MNFFKSILDRHNINSRNGVNAIDSVYGMNSINGVNGGNDRNGVYNPIPSLLLVGFLRGFA